MKLFVGAKGLIARPDGKVLIVREGSEYDEGTEEGKWDVVGGRIEDDERLFDGLRREIKEESGLSVEVGELLGVSENFPIINGAETHIIRVYYACATEKADVILSSDHDRYQWADPKDYKGYDLMEDVAEMFKIYLKKFDTKFI